MYLVGRESFFVSPLFNEIITNIYQLLYTKHALKFRLKLYFKKIEGFLFSLYINKFTKIFNIILLHGLRLFFTVIRLPSPDLCSDGWNL